MPISQYICNLRRKIGHDLLLIPGVTALIFNEAGDVLLQRSADDGRWYTIGGAMDPHETPAQAAEREVLEETGLRVAAQRIVGVYADPQAVYPSGDRVQYISICFVCRILKGQSGIQPRAADDESLELRYFPPSQLPELLPTHRHRIEQALKYEDRAYFDRSKTET